MGRGEGDRLGTGQRDRETGQSSTGAAHLAHGHHREQSDLIEFQLEQHDLPCAMVRQ